MLPVVVLDGMLLGPSSWSLSDASKTSSWSTSAAWTVECLMDCLPNLKACGTVSMTIQFLVLVSSTINVAQHIAQHTGDLVSPCIREPSVGNNPSG